MPPRPRSAAPLAAPTPAPMLPRFPRHTGAAAQISGAQPLPTPLPGSDPANDTGVSKADFFVLAVAAWLRDPMKPLAVQMANDIDRAQRTCEFWLSANGRHAPAWVVKRAYELADQHGAQLATTLDRLADQVAALPDDRPQD